MAGWNSKKIERKSKEDFEEAWNETKNLVKIKKSRSYTEGGHGSEHSVSRTIGGVRKSYLKIGFNEVINPLLIEDKEIHRQFGPEATAVLDRCYYIAGLPRPDIGISEKKMKKIEKMGLKASKEDLQEVLRGYKTGVIDGDDLVTEIAKGLGTDDGTALKVLDKVFPEIKGLKPRASQTTLRSHMTSGWFLTLQSLNNRVDLPLKLFSIDRCFRREQREDKGHLRTYYSASSVIMDDRVALENGREIVESILEEFGFSDFRFQLDPKRSKYYAPDTQTEVYGLSPGGEWVEIATFGMYSPVALSRYGIETPVLNIGIGVERLSQVLTAERDIRKLVMSQFHYDLELSDEELAKSISFIAEPCSEDGKALAQKIVEEARSHAQDPGPTEVGVYEGSFMGRKIKVSLVEVEENAKLLGPAALNRIIVLDGNILGVSEKKALSMVEEGAVDVGLTYVHGLANMAARAVEDALASGEDEGKVQIKGAKLPSDINIRLKDLAARFISSSQKKIDLRGPVFTTLTFTVE